jgi:acyl-CoA thioester hydrolase
MGTELGRSTNSKPPFRYSAVTRVWFSDTDAQGVVYYGRYLPYFDFARVEYARHLQTQGLGASAHEFVMRACSIEYEAPARFDDLLEVFIRTRRIGRSSVTQEFAVYRVEDDLLMCRATQTVVFIDVATRLPISVPAEFRRAVADFEGPDLESA